MLSGQKTGIAQFGPFELHLETGELRKHGIRIRLQTKPFQILQALLETPGEVVTREELRLRLWSADTFVDFENGLNTAANRLRIALGDSAESPRYVETLARVGYRFIAPVRYIAPIERPAARATPVAPEVVPPPEPEAEPAPVAAPAAETPAVAIAPIPAVERPKPRWLLALIGVLILSNVVLLLIAWTQRTPENPLFKQMTFRRGVVASARFTPDGESIVYTAKWGQALRELFLVNPMSPESRSLGRSGVSLLSVSSTGELALLGNVPGAANKRPVLSRVPMHGGDPMQITADVHEADWSPDGNQMAVVRVTGMQSSLEYPVGKVLYRTGGHISWVRISPQGDSVAFLDHHVWNDETGSVKLVNLKGEVRRLTDDWLSLKGLAWSARGDEIWFTAARSGLKRCLYAVNRDGHLRMVASVPGPLTLHDISRQGRALVTHDNEHFSMTARLAGDKEERDLSWFDASRAQEISADGKSILFDETGEGGGPKYSAYLYRAGSQNVVRLGTGMAMDLSADGKWVLTMDPDDRTHLKILAVGGGQSRTVAAAGLRYQLAWFFPDMKQLLIVAQDREGQVRMLLQSLEDNSVKPLDGVEYLADAAISADGKWVAGRDRDYRLVVWPVAGGKPKPIETDQPLLPIRWSADGQSLYCQSIYKGFGMIGIYRVRVATGEKELLQELGPKDPAGVSYLFRVRVTPDGQNYVYSYPRILSELHLVEGWR